MRTKTCRTVLSTLGAVGALAGAVLGAPGEARAQAAVAPAGNFQLNRFEPSYAGDRFFGVPSPYAAGKVGFHAGVLLDYSHNPLVLRQKDAAGNAKDVGAIVENQMYLHINATLALWNRLAINMNLPVALWQSGASPSGGGNTFTSPSNPEIGDLRLGLRLRLLGEYHDAFQLGLSGALWVPTGTTAQYQTYGEVRGMPQLLLGGRADRFIWSLAGGPEFRKNFTYYNVAQGTNMQVGGGLGVLLGEMRRFQLGVELNSGFVLENGDSKNINAEARVGAKWRFIPDMEAGLAVGPGLAGGVGTPDVRVLFGLAYTPEQKLPMDDRDKDGIADDKDACPDVAGVASEDPAKNGCPPVLDNDKDGIVNDQDACPEVPGVADPDPKKNGCPVGDKDKDGIADDKDACPEVAGVANEDPKKNGCPKDTDDDGIPDSEDACPDIKGIKTADKATNGCPGDTDGDGFRDDKDACPNEKGVDQGDPAKNGCPKSVRVKDGEIVILQQVQFDTGKATIKKVSDELLNEVADVLKQHGEIAKLEVQGHTDTRGSKQLNTKLSDSRAKSVQKALETRGVKTGLVAKGYGPDKTLCDDKAGSKTEKDDCAARNRRVQFIILEKAPPAAPTP